MSARIAAEGDPLVMAPIEVPAQQTSAPIAAVSLDPDDRFGGNALPHDHPQWMKDTLSISQRARALLKRLRPAVVHVFTAWDHRVRSIAIGGRTLRVDASGSYRFD